MAAMPSVKVVKQSLWKGVEHRWSNRYHFDGGTPADDAHWQTLFTNIRNAEKLILPSGTGIEEILGYAAGSDVPVASWTGDVAGTFAPGALLAALPQDAALVRYSTTQRTTKNHPIYLFNYYHSCFYDNTANSTDTIGPAYKTALETYASAWLSGFSDGANTYHRAGPNGAVAQSRLVEGFLTHRDFRS